MFSLIQNLRQRIHDLEHGKKPSPAATGMPTGSSDHRQHEERSPLTLQSLTNPETSPGVSAMVGAATGEPQREGFHGISSTAAFMADVRQAIEGRRSDTRLPEVQQAQEGARASLAMKKYVLPPRSLAETLLPAYWEFVFPLYPFLNEKRFRTMYDALWKGAAFSTPSISLLGNQEEIVVCILNIVLALACQYWPEPDPRTAREQARVFIDRAHTLIEIDLLATDGKTVQHVEAMLLFAQFLIGTGSAYRAYMILGSAIRLCHQLGLHRSSTYTFQTIPDVSDREATKRIYNGCLMMET